MFNRYNQLLVRRPLLTNVITAGVVFGSGDVLAQTLFPAQEETSRKYDFPRTFRSVFFGAVVFAPIGDRWYKFLATIGTKSGGVGSVSAGVTLNASKKVNSFNLSSVVPLVSRVAIDQLFFAPFVGIPLYYSVMTLLEGHSPAHVVDKLNNEWLTTLVDNWRVWPAFQCFNFWLVPVGYRLLSGNLFGVGWNCYLSYHLNRPTEKEIVEVK